MSKSSFTDEKFETMKKWETFVTLMGFSITDMFDDWDEEDDDKFLEILGTMERVNRLMASPTKAMTTALRTIEMGITTRDIDEYAYALEEIAEEEIARAIEEKTVSNPLIAELRDDYGFKWTTSKLYPNHKHYVFLNKDGVQVSGRSFRKSYSIVRNWLSWRDKDGKLVKHMQDTRDIAIPKGFPESWNTWASTTSDVERMPWILAHHIIHKNMPKRYFDGATF